MLANLVGQGVDVVQVMPHTAAGVVPLVCFLRLELNLGHKSTNFLCPARLFATPICDTAKITSS